MKNTAAIGLIFTPFGFFGYVHICNIDAEKNHEVYYS